MIRGIGTDIVEIARVQSILESQHAEKFTIRILAQAEREYAINRKQGYIQFVAGRFAAKEAIAKAIGCGIGVNLSFQDIEILPDREGKPLVRLHLQAQKRCQLNTNTHIHLSISHERAFAIAYAIVEQF